jgi:hypothetical protein
MTILWILLFSITVGNNAATAAGDPGKMKAEYNTVYMQVIKIQLRVGGIVLGRHLDKKKRSIHFSLLYVWNMPHASHPP